MTDEEKDKTEKEYKKWLVNDHKLLDNPTYYDIEQKCFRAFFAGTRYGLAEGRKEKCLEQNNDGTIRPCEVMKENAELKAQVEKMKCCENCKHSYTDSENLIFCYLPISQEECKSCRIYNHKETENDYWEQAE